MAAVAEATHVGSSAEELLGEVPEAQEEHSSNHSDSDEGSEGGGGTDDDEGASDDGEDKEAGDDDGAEAGDEDGGEEGEEGNQNAGWAEAMAKILGKKTPESKPSILLKNKQLDKLKEKEKQEQLERKKQVDKKRTWEMMCRDKPDLVKDREMERNLQRIATRGVVQLFNAVRKHQKQVDEKVKEVGGSERKKAKLLSSISKKDFINVLRGTDVPVKKERPTGQAGAGEEDEKPAWSVLRDDFMMGAAMKDWDKESDAEDGDAEETPEAAAAVGDSDSD